jgi:UDP-N-acetylmuramoylalanine--D-glutamate ligase
MRVVVAGLGASGTAAAEALARVGADVTAVDAADPASLSPRAAGLAQRGVHLVTGADGDDPAVLAGAALVVASPGWAPHHPLLRAAVGAGIRVWAEAELAWRLREPDGPGWVCVTGTNGKTTTVGLVDAILRATGLRSRTAGNIGTPLVDAVLDPDPADVLAVELSSFQLHGVHTVAPLASVVLNIADDHLDWHGGFDAYAAAKARIYDRTTAACVHNVEQPLTGDLARRAITSDGCRRVGFTTRVPGPGALGVVGHLIVDRAYVRDPGEAREIATLDDVAALAPGPPRHLVADAVAAAAVALAAGADPAAVAPGLRSAAVPGHRGAVVSVAGGVRFVDDSKATNPHAADAALRSAAGRGHVVWIAGGQAKGARFDEVVRAHRRHLRAAVLIGADRDVVADALDRHAPEVPRIRVDPPDTGAMAGAVGQAAAGPTGELVEDYLDRVVAAAAAHARPGDTVLLAPGGASLDQFASYAARGEAFARAVLRLTGESASPGGADPPPANR